MALLTIAENQGGGPGAARAALELAQAAGRGDETARRRLMERLIDRVRSTAHYLAAGHPDAEDCAQQALIEILRSAGSFRGDSSLESWADRIAIRVTMRQLKRLRWRGKIVTLDPTVLGQSEATAEDQLVRDRISRRLAELLGALKPKHRSVVTMRLFLGYSIAEIAEATDANPNTVRYRLGVGRKKLRRKIQLDPELGQLVGRAKR